MVLRPVVAVADLPAVPLLPGRHAASQRLGLQRANDFVNNVSYHEFAHQWWGHLVGAATYRDQWMEEGFSEFSAALAVQHARGWGEYDRFWRESRKVILDKYPGNAVAHNDAGPLVQGWRLATQRSPSAYSAVVYSKGGYVLHMLRMLMWEQGSPNPDAKFIALMKDYTSTYGGKLATTADFQQVVERHMTPAMNAKGDGKMDWFFQQWVYGTEVPRYEHDLKFAKGDEGKTRLTGTIRQDRSLPGFPRPGAHLPGVRQGRDGAGRHDPHGGRGQHADRRAAPAAQEAQESPPQRPRRGSGAGVRTGGQP